MNLKKSLIVVNSFKEESKVLGSQIQAYLESLGIATDIFLFNGFSEQYPFYGYDFVITMGGDGTVLFASRGCAPLGIPIFPINFGSFGFIASVQRNEWKKDLDEFLAGNSIIDERSMLQADLIRGGSRRLSATGLNDVVICGKTATHTLSFNVLYSSFQSL